MTRKDYLLIAAALKRTHRTVNVPTAAARQWAADVTALADALTQDNPNGFNRGQFLTNCGVQS